MSGSNFRSTKRIPQSLLQGRQGSGRSSALKNGQQLKRAAYICAFVFCLQALLGTVDADPVLASSLGFCKTVPVLKGAPLHCCLPAPKRTPIRFRFPLIPRNLAGRLFLRERKPAHVVQKDPEYVRKYNLAYARMKALPDTDPRSFLNQWRLQENVVLEKVKIPHSEYARFDVFINYPAANRQTHLYMSEYVGTFTHLPSGMVDMSKAVSESSSNSDEFRIVTIRYSVNAALKRLGITDYNTDIVVTIVSKGARNTGPKTGFTFSNLKQDFQ
ncbi:hypothetical protein AXG93_3548s1030 [Marchantia polymorpha subsp. ruderalis]|uniref:Polyphenol oxidase C-terminal domain-containing protein n=1 Tax=Marchantia polymorpha subsp. ruderalis TaxID=1480154 RepID=A0A176VET4_MARPO|nr:hypothetical protein AXG93_3548s1030 [Marchantia polymorpha subsp. ruderalis]